MTLISIYDAAYAPDSPPAADGAAFYMGGSKALNVWTPEQVDAQPARYRLPIWVRSGSGAGDGAHDGHAAAGALARYGAPRGILVACDVETVVDLPYASSFAYQLKMTRGDEVIVYGSLDTRSGYPSLPRWLADWDGQPVLQFGAAMIQYKSGPDFDMSVAESSLPLWDTRPASPATQRPAIPAGLKATPGATSISLEWTPDPGATSYTVRVTYQGQPVQQEMPQKPACWITGLTPDHTYGLHVSAANGAGTSPEASITAKTLR